LPPAVLVKPCHCSAFTGAMAEPSDHVIIGNLPEDIDEETMKTNFEAYGTIKWAKLFNGKGGGGKKSAMIEFSSVEEATWLVENLDGNVPLGLETEVSVKFKPPKGAGGGGCGGGGFGKGGCGGGNRSSPYGGIIPAGKGGMMGGKMGGKMGGMMGMSGEPSTINDLWKGLLRHKVLPGGSWANDERTVCVNGLPSDTTEADLYRIFSTFGAILPGGVSVKLNDDGTAKGNGMVNFANLESAIASIETLNNCMMPDGRTIRLRKFGDWGGGGKKGGGKSNGGLIEPKES